MELYQIRCFLAAAERLNFSRAAESLHLSQPSLSAAIQRLETDLKAPLFLRRGRQVRLTAAGEALVPTARRILQQAEEARQVVREVQGLERGRLTLYALPALDQHLLPRMLARYRRERPGISLRVRELRPAAAIASAVAQGEADLGFLHLPCTAAGLEVRELLHDPFALVVPEHHPFARRREAPLADAAGLEFVWVHDAQEADHPLYAACVRAGFQPRIVCESGSVQGVLALVAAGLGCALLPVLAIEPRPGTVTVPLARPRPQRTLAAVWSAEDLSPAAADFVRLCLPEPAGRRGHPS